MGFKGFIIACTLVVGTTAQAYVIMDTPSPDRLLQDQRECAAVARQHQNASGQSLQSPVYSNAGPLSGPARGAMLGTAAGVAVGHTGRGAILGALGGSVNAGMQTSDAYLEQSAVQDGVQRAQQGVYNQTFNACMQARGYDVD